MQAPPLLIKAHRWLGLVMSLALLVWAITGGLYALMQSTRPLPAKQVPPPQALDLRKAIALPSILTHQGWRSVQQASAVQLDSTLTAYRVKLIGNPIARYYNVMTGQDIAGGESLDAQRLALWYSGQSVNQLTQAQVVTAFSDDYPARHRVLPVWQVSFADGLRVYVDPSQSRLISLSNDQQMWLARLFRIGHTWSLDQIDWPEKKPIMAGYLIGIMLLVIGGISLSMLRRQAHQPVIEHASMVRRWHRRLGSLLAVFIFFWASSGLFHVIRSVDHKPFKPSVFLVSDLSVSAWQQAVLQPIARIDVVAHQSTLMANQAAWLTQPLNSASTTAQQWHLTDADTGQSLADGLTQQAHNFAARYAQLKPTQVSHVSLLASNKVAMLGPNVQPILQIDTRTTDHLTLYIDPISGQLLAKQNDTDVLVAGLFAALHQWQGLPIAQSLRHSLIGIVSVMVALLGVLGLILWGMRRYSRQAL